MEKKLRLNRMDNCRQAVAPRHLADHPVQAVQADRADQGGQGGQEGPEGQEQNQHFITMIAKLMRGWSQLSSCRLS